MTVSLNLKAIQFLSVVFVLNIIHTHTHVHMHTCILVEHRIGLVAYPIVAYVSSPFFFARAVCLSQENLKCQLPAFIPSFIGARGAMCTVVGSKVIESCRGNMMWHISEVTMWRSSGVAIETLLQWLYDTGMGWLCDTVLGCNVM